MRRRWSASTEWVTLGLIIGCYGLWLILGQLWLTNFWPLTLIVMPFVAAFHSSLQHETIHGHPTAWGWLNELLVSLPLSVAFPYRRYRDLHLQHHRDEHLTDPFEDPESYFWPPGQVKKMNAFQKRAFEINNMFLGRLAIGPILTVIGFGRTELQRLKKGEAGVRFAWCLHLIELLALVLLLQSMGLPLWIYGVFVVYPALSLTAMRAYAEHQAAENVGARSAVVETHPFWALLYLNNNLHIVHHASPATPWYDVPKLYTERRQQYLAANENTLFLGYRDIMRRFAFTVKQPVAHPIMERDQAPTKGPVQSL